MRRLGRLITYLAAAELLGELVGWLIFRRSNHSHEIGKATP